MGALVVIVVVAALGAGSIIRDHLPPADQFTFVLAAFGALALLFGVAAFIRACCIDDASVRWSRSVGRS